MRPSLDSETLLDEESAGITFGPWTIKTTTKQTIAKREYYDKT
jgi:hypothetical protein